MLRILSLLLAGIFLIGSVVMVMMRDDDVISEVEMTNSDEVIWQGEATERYSARVDRVDVVFEHKDYIAYRLITNGLVRTGELNTERGFGDDIDATVYVLNWQKPEGEQIRYVRLTAEPTHLYILDSNQEIIRGSKLTKDES